MIIYHVYLSGPITGLTYDEGDDWRKHAAAMLNENIVALNPLRCKEWAREFGIIDDTTTDKHPWMSSDNFIGTRDAWDAMRCDVMLVNLIGATQVSIGTVLEIGMAHATNVPIFVAMEDTGNPHEHGMIRSYTTMRFNNTLDAIFATNALLSV